MIPVDKLTEPQRQSLWSIINNFGTGEHPYAEDDNGKYFVLEYAVECVQKALESGKLSELGKEHFTEILKILKINNDEYGNKMPIL